ncbi:MAG: S9 family peptidase [Caulobacteraceae bacterium]|nr:S9 family peptidase [Caulobacteraceae bacterium]
MRRWAVWAGIAGMTIFSAGQAAGQGAPVAAARPHAVASPGGVRSDPYYWLRDDTRKNPDMLAYLKAENAHTDAVTAKQKPLQDKIYAEIVGRIKQDDSSVPYEKRGYLYYDRFETGKDYPITARRKSAMSAPEEVMLDQPAMAAGKGFFQVASAAVSPDNRLLAWAQDTVGRRQYTLKVKDLTTGQIMADEVADIEPGAVWADDNRTIFYVEKDPVTLLSKRVKAHVLGTPASADIVVYQENDDSFYIGLTRSRSDKYICILLESTVSSEQRCAPARAPKLFAILAPRRRDFLYQADHLDGRWVIRTNWDAPNYRLMSLADGEAWGDRGRWRERVAHDSKVFIADVDLFHGVLAIEERSGGLKRLRTLADAGESRFITAEEPAYAMSLGVNADPDSPWLRYTYDSLTTPTTTYEVNLKTRERRLLKVQAVNGYDPSLYRTERVWVTARDGTRIPVSMVYREGFKRDGTAAMLQHAYGSYGESTDPEFWLPVVSLLDRGMVFAIAHVRGGQEMGRAWYDDGHLLKKKNTFTDFIDVTRGLVAQGYAAKGRVAALGTSAGGLLMGAVANLAPDDYRVIIARVPFVDAVTTMLDESIPLTTNEFDEWGNPKDKRFYDYMLSYSPYDNVAAKAYPAMFVTTGLWDSQVQYYEPAKWVAKLRATKTDDHPLVLRVNMEAGHGGKSGRFRQFRDIAEYYAYMLDQLGAGG